MAEQTVLIGSEVVGLYELGRAFSVVFGLFHPNQH